MKEKIVSGVWILSSVVFCVWMISLLFFNPVIGVREITMRASNDGTTRIGVNIFNYGSGIAKNMSVSYEFRQCYDISNYNPPDCEHLNWNIVQSRDMNSGFSLIPHQEIDKLLVYTSQETLEKRINAYDAALKLIITIKYKDGFRLTHKVTYLYLITNIGVRGLYDITLQATE